LLKTRVKEWTDAAGSEAMAGDAVDGTVDADVATVMSGTSPVA
jgi:hypothetical protein